MADTQVFEDFAVDLVQGATFERNYQWTDSGVAVDITGATIDFAMTNDFSGAAVFSGTGVLTNAANGEFQIVLTDVVTGAVEPVLLGNSGSTIPIVGLEVQYQVLALNVNVTLGGTVYPLIRGTCHFYPSALV